MNRFGMFSYASTSAQISDNMSLVSPKTYHEVSMKDFRQTESMMSVADDPQKPLSTAVWV